MSVIKRIFKFKNSDGVYDEVHFKTDTSVVYTANNTVLETKLGTMDTSISTNATNITTNTTDIATLNTNKATKVSGTVENKLAKLDSNGDLAATDKVIGDLQLKINGKNNLTLATDSWTAVGEDKDEWSQDISDTIKQVLSNVGVPSTDYPYIMVDVQAGSTVIKQMIKDGTNAIYITNGATSDPTFTAYAVGEKPTDDLLVQVTFTKVNMTS